MELTRRKALAVGGIVTASTSVPASLLANLPQYTTAQKNTRMNDVRNNRAEYTTRNTNLRAQRFKIRIKNDFQWDIKFGILGMHNGMNWRRRVPGSGGIYQSPIPKIDGGERVAVIWDDFSESMLDMQWVLVAANLTVEIDANGLMTIT